MNTDTRFGSQANLVLWDGSCGLCQRATTWIAERDAAHQFELIPYQQAPSPPMYPALQARCAKAVHVITVSGQTLRAGRASLFVLDKLGFRRTAWLLGRRPLVWLVELGYWLVARNRRFFGRFLFRRQDRNSR